MKGIIILTLLLTVGIIFSFKSSTVDFTEDTPNGIQFHKASWNEALDLAKKQNKLVFLDIYATWCRPCKKLKASTFSDVEVGTFYNQNFINVSLDGEKGEGLKLAQKYNVRGYPSLLFLDASGNIVARTTGYRNVGKFIELGKEVKT